MDLCIEKAYLMITTQCNINCRYCIVRDTNEVMPLETINKSIDFVCNSHGDFKKIVIYGGEPLIKFNLIQHIVQRTNLIREKLNKKIDVFIFTNGLLLSKKILKYLNTNKVRLLFSLDIARLLDNTPENADTKKIQQAKLKKLDMVTDHLDSNDICLVPVVLPDEVSLTYPIFKYAVEECGIRNVKVLPGLMRYNWDTTQIEILKDSLDKIFKLILMKISNNEVYCFDMVNESLHRFLNNSQANFVQNLSMIEIYPDGAFGLPPCIFNTPKFMRHTNDVKDMRLGFVDSIDSQDIIDRIKLLDLEENAGLKFISQWSTKTALYLHKLSQNNPKVESYVNYAINHSFA